MKAMIELKALKTIIAATKDFTSKSDNRPMLQFVRIDFNADASTATAKAVDGYRMSMESAVCTVDESFTAYVKPMLPTGNSKSYAVVELKDDVCYINVDGSITGFKQPHGEVFNFEKALYDTEQKPISYRIGFNGSLLMSALRGAQVSVGDCFKDPVVLEFRGETEPIILRTGKKNVKLVLPVRIRDAETNTVSFK